VVSVTSSLTITPMFHRTFECKDHEDSAMT
jgi:hypothetical protein